MPKIITIQPSGHQFSVNEQETVLDAALRQGITLSYGCRNGACGSCQGRIIDGEIKYAEGMIPSALENNDPQQGLAIFCQAIPQTDMTIEAHEVAAVKDIPVKTLPCRVVRIEHLNHDVIEMRLKLPITERLQFLAGQYVDFLLKDGRRRSFSIANAPHNDVFIELHIRHIQDGRFTGMVFDEIQEKDILRIEGPLGNFFIRENSTRPIIIMAGGTGIAPIKSMIDYCLSAKCDRSVHIYWGARSKQDLYINDEVQSWANTNENIRYTAVLVEPKIEDKWHGRTGYVHQAIMDDYDDLSEYDIYGSGPPIMVYAGRDHFIEKGLDLRNYYSDAFEFANDWRS